MPIDEEQLNLLRANDPSLLSLNLSGEGIDDDDIAVLCEALRPNTRLVELDLSENDEFSLQSLSQLVLVLNQKPCLTKLNLANCQLGDAVGAIINQLIHVKSVDLSVNDLTDAGVSALQATTLTSLNLDCNEIGDDGAVILAQENSLTHLNLSNNNLTDNGVTALARKTKLKKLELTDGTDLPFDLRISDRAAIQLANATNLAHLDLSAQNISDDSAEAFLYMRHLLTLNLCANNIAPAGAAVLASSPSLLILNLQSTRVGRLACDRFLDNKRLLRLNLRNCHLSHEQTTQIAHRIQTNRRNYIKTLFTAAVFLFNRFEEQHIARLVLAYLPEDDDGILGINLLAERVVTRTKANLPVCFFSHRIPSVAVRPETSHNQFPGKNQHAYS